MSENRGSYTFSRPQTLQFASVPTFKENDPNLCNTYRAQLAESNQKVIAHEGTIRHNQQTMDTLAAERNSYRDSLNQCNSALGTCNFKATQTSATTRETAADTARTIQSLREQNIRSESQTDGVLKLGIAAIDRPVPTPVVQNPNVQSNFDALLKLTETLANRRDTTVPTTTPPADINITVNSSSTSTGSGTGSATGAGAGTANPNTTATSSNQLTQGQDRYNSDYREPLIQQPQFIVVPGGGGGGGCAVL